MNDNQSQPHLGGELDPMPWGSSESAPVAPTTVHKPTPSPFSSDDEYFYGFSSPAKSGNGGWMW